MTVQKAILLILAISWSASGSHLQCDNEECRGSWRAPQSDYVAEWCATNEEVTFEVTAKTSGWIGIGFSKNKKMPGSDVVVAGMAKDGTSFIEDRWADRRKRPSLDGTQDIYNTFVNQTDDVTTMHFTRKRNTEDKNDLNLDCQYFLYAWGGNINQNSMILKHKYTEVSDKNICMCPVSLTPTFTIIPNPTDIPPRPNPTVIPPRPNPTVVYPRPDPTVVPTRPTRPQPPECPPQCLVAHDRCQNSLLCKPLLDKYDKACRDVIEYNNTGDMPVCTEECKDAAEELETDRLGMFYKCCSCDNEMCSHGRRNFERFCKIAPMESMKCKEMQRACDMNTPSTCLSCQVHEDFCKKNATCKALFDDTEMKCKSIFEWNRSMNDKEPVCTEGCKSSLMQLRQFGGREDNCCSCGKIADNRNINDLRYTINCHQKRRNAIRFCSDPMIPPARCDQCKDQEEPLSPIKCFDVLKMCSSDKNCKKMMDDMEKKCAPVTSWNKDKGEEPRCSEDCNKAVATLNAHKIGQLWTQCDCRMPKRDNYYSLSRDDGFEKKCITGQNNLRSFCFYNNHCKGGLKTKCDWVVSVCEKDPSCWQRYLDREQKCGKVFNWTDTMNRPVCTDECKQANQKLLQHDIWRWNVDCDCGKFGDRKELKEIRKIEQCHRKRRNFFFYCAPSIEISCPKDPCEPNVCSIAKDMCFKSHSCQALYKDWEMKCKGVWESTTDMCSDDCKTATHQLHKDQFGQNLKWCDCGVYEEVLAGDRSAKELAALTQCFERKHKMKELCEIEDAGQCQICRKNKVCERPCDRVVPHCRNNTICSEIFDNFSTACQEVMMWNISSTTTPTCSDECKKWADQLYMNPIGKNMKCCHCDRQDKICIYHRRNMGVFCGVDFNNVSECHNDARICGAGGPMRDGDDGPTRFGDNNRPMRDGNNDNDRRGGGNDRPRDGNNDNDRNRNGTNRDGNNRDGNNDNDRNRNGTNRDGNNDNDRNRNGTNRDGNNDNDRNRNGTNRDGNNRDGNNDNDRNRNGTNRDGNNDRRGDRPMREDDRNEPDNRRERDDMMPPRDCLGWIDMCRRDKCCGKAFHEANYYCKEVRHWDGTGDAPQCSKRCSDASAILLNDTIGKNLGCCECPKFSDIDKSNRLDVERVMFCKGSQKNMDDICNVAQMANCTRPDKYQETCAVDSCHNATMKCRDNVTCSDLYDAMEEKCGSVLQSDDPMCSDDCRQAVIQLHTHPIGYRLRCCDCGFPLGLTMGHHPSQGQMDRMRPENMMDMMSPPRCHLTKSKITKHCGLIDDCEDCKASVCPGSCVTVTAHCINNTKCNHIWENYHRECERVITWDGSTAMPVCTDECKKWINEMEKNTIGQFFKCCSCDDKNKTSRMECALKKRNTEELCDVKLDSAEVCQYHRKTCDFVKKKERSIKRRDQCPPATCDDWRKRCTNDKRCLKLFNDFRFQCQDVMEWRDDQTEPTCTSDCQQAMKNLASMTNRTMGGNLLCCECGNYSDLYSNSLESVRAWERCKRHELNIRRFCGRQKDCADCRRRPMGRPNRPKMPSCAASTRMCESISECRNMRSNIRSSCSNILLWDRGVGPRPQCTPQCRRALNQMAGSNYHRTACCDCQGDDMTARESVQCQAWHRNLQDICNFRPDRYCDVDRPDRNRPNIRDDCFYHMETCNRDMQCREQFFNYTDKCALAFSGKPMKADQEMMCKETAKELVEYKEFGKNITQCECNTYPELCKEMFKNRFLFDKSCKEAEDRCKSNTTCNMLWNNHKSCMVTSTSCPWSCRAKAVLLYRHRLGRAWWQTCRPHHFEQVCFVIY